MYLPPQRFVSCENSLDSMACLRSADVALLDAANVAITLANFAGTFTFVPVVDDTFIVDRPTEILKRGQVNGVSIPLFD